MQLHQSTVQLHQSTRQLAPCLAAPRVSAAGCVPRARRAALRRAFQEASPAGGAEAATPAPAPAARKKAPGSASHVGQALAELEKPKDAAGRKMCIAQVAPAVRVAIGDAFGLEPGAIPVGKLVTALRMIGFDYVFDTNFAADLTIMEEGSELLHRLSQHLDKQNGEPMPMFTSCCPGWVNMVEKNYPELIPYLSSCKSPQMMMGAVVKNYFAETKGVKPTDMALISVMPCVRKQAEADRPTCDTSGTRDVDHVLTTAEIAKVIKDKGIDLVSLEESPFDDPLGGASGGAQLFGTTGGVMEAALRTVYEIVSGQPMGRLMFEEVRGMEGIKECTLNIKPADGSPFKKYDPEGKGLELHIAVANGLGNAKKVITGMKAGTNHYDFVEVMACPGGCVGGGGQPRSTDKAALLKRQQAIYNIDDRLTVRRPHENPAIQKLYKAWLAEGPISHKAEHYLHTQYIPGGPGGDDE